MLKLDFLESGVLSETNGDLDYLFVLERFGDTTNPYAHVEAPAPLVCSEFITNGSLGAGGATDCQGRSCCWLLQVRSVC